MADNIDVTVLYINYKTPKLVCDSIHSLMEKSSGFSYEIIVMDNASGDDSKTIINDTFHSSVRYIQNQTNLGTAKAVDEGAKIAKGDYIFYVNTDTLFINNAIFELLQFMREHRNVAVTGCNLYNSDKDPTHSFMKKFFGMGFFRRRTSLIYMTFSKLLSKKTNKQFNYTNKPLEVDFVCGAATLMRKDIFLKLGGYDHDIFMYGEEPLYAYHCKQCGFLSYNVPSAKMIHFEGDSFKKNGSDYSEARVRRYYDGMYVYINKIYGEKNVIKYYKYCRKALEKKKFVYSFMRKKQKAINCKAEIDVLTELINKANQKQLGEKR